MGKTHKDRPMEPSEAQGTAASHCAGAAFICDTPSSHEYSGSVAKLQYIQTILYYLVAVHWF